MNTVVIVVAVWLGLCFVIGLFNAGAHRHHPHHGHHHGMRHIERHVRRHR